MRESGNTLTKFVIYINSRRKLMIQLLREVLHYIFIEISIPVKLERLIQMCLHGIYNRMHVGNICLTYSLLRIV